MDESELDEAGSYIRDLVAEYRYYQDATADDEGMSDEDVEGKKGLES